MKYVKFYYWLAKQKKRDDRIGDFARDVMRDRDFPCETTRRREVEQYLRSKPYASDLIRIARQAWKEMETGVKERTGLTPKLRFSILKRDAFKCQLCGATAPEAKLEIDHRHPKSRGGKDNHENLWTLCFACNRGKGTSLLT